MHMKPPKCRACGISEWNHVCGGLTEKSPPKVPKKGKNSLEERLAVLEAKVAVLAERLVPTDKRREYMREYMAQRRAKH